MFISFWKKFIHNLKVNKIWKQVLVYGIVAFLIMQCYQLPFASENENPAEEVASIGDATWIDAYPDMDLHEQENDDLQVETDGIEVYSANSDLYYQAPDTTNPFVAYAMTIPRGSGMNSDNLCATYVSQALYGYYGDEASVSGMTLVSQISNTLAGSERWECVYADAACLPAGKTEAEFDAIFDGLTNPGDIVCFVNGSLDNYVHCGIAGGGTALIGHLKSSGWDSLRACYYIDNAVDVRKICSGMIIYRYKEKPKKGTICVCKSYNEAVYKTNPKLYDIAGANYAVYANREDAVKGTNAQGYCYIEPDWNGGPAGDNVSCTATTYPNQNGVEVQFEEGTYYVKEYNVPTSGGWYIDPTVYETQIYADKLTVLGLPRDSNANPINFDDYFLYCDTQTIGPEREFLGELRLNKKVETSYQEMIQNNPNYSLDGIEYTIYAVSGDQVFDGSNPVGTFRMDESGNGIVQSCSHDTACIGTKAMKLRLGWYLIYETKTNASMRINTTPKWVQIRGGYMVPSMITVEDKPQYASVGLLLQKRGKEQQPVAGAYYEIKYYPCVSDQNPEQNGISAVRTWNFKTDQNGQIFYKNDPVWFVDGDAFYKDEYGNEVLPAGTITIRETQAPEGYLLDDTVYVKRIVPDGEKMVMSENVTYVTEKEIRGDLSFRKVNEEGTPLANVEFLITDEAGSSYHVWTDQNGYYSTAASFIPHSYRTNEQKQGCGIWFGQAAVDDAQGALPYGEYRIQELRCEANKNQYRNMETVTVRISENDKVIMLGTFVNHKFSSITTKAGYKLSDFTGIENSIVPCKDVVSFDGLEIGHTYRIRGEVRWKEDAGLLDEKYIEQSGYTEFVADKKQMDIDVFYKIKYCEALAGKPIVFFEYVEDTAYPGETIAVHTDINDQMQTICFPKREEPTTEEVTTEAPTTTEEVTTEAPTTTENVTTEVPTTTEEVTTEAPTTTEKVTTEAPTTTEKVTTETPTTTEEVTTEAPTTTEENTTETPTTTEEVTTEVSTTTEEVTTEIPTTTEKIITVEILPTTEVMGTSETPTTTAITTEESQTEDAVKTGDEANLFLMIMILSTTFVGIVLMILGKKRNKR